MSVVLTPAAADWINAWPTRLVSSHTFLSGSTFSFWNSCIINQLVDLSHGSHSQSNSSTDCTINTKTNIQTTTICYHHSKAHVTTVTASIFLRVMRVDSCPVYRQKTYFSRNVQCSFFGAFLGFFTQMGTTSPLTTCLIVQYMSSLSANCSVHRILTFDLNW